MNASDGNEQPLIRGTFGGWCYGGYFKEGTSFYPDDGYRDGTRLTSEEYPLAKIEEMLLQLGAALGVEFEGLDGASLVRKMYERAYPDSDSGSRPEGENAEGG